MAKVLVADDEHAGALDVSRFADHSLGAWQEIAHRETEVRSLVSRQHPAVH